MFTSSALALLFIAIKFLIGLGIGVLVGASLYRSRFCGWLAVRSAVFGGVAFLICSGIAGWAGSHAAFLNGRRMDVAPWGEDLRLRNFIAQNEALLCVVGASIAAILAGVRLSRKHQAGLG